MNLKAYEKGYKAFFYGDFNNPYSKDSFDYKEWERGFNSAYFNNKQAGEPSHEARG